MRLEMGEAVFRVNGVDFLEYIKLGGIAITRYEIDSKEAGMMLNGVTRRDVISIRYHINIAPIGNHKDTKYFISSDVSKILTALEPQLVDVEFNDPKTAAVTTRTLYNSRITARPAEEYYDGILWWRIEPFNLIDKGVPVST
jgi:hypothetical protein